MEKLVLLLSPLAPHLCEELWQVLGHDRTLAYEAWPKHDEQYVRDAMIEIPVQINGKLRGKVTVPADAGNTIMEAAAREAVQDQLALKQEVLVKVVPGRLVNFVIK